MSVQYRIVSIGTLSRNPFWNESQSKRPAHATTTLIQEGQTTILVDPSLPPDVLAQRLEERTGLQPDRIGVVFLTTFRPVHRRALPLFVKAAWLMHEPEILAMRSHLEELSDRHNGHADEVRRLVNDELALLKKVSPAADRLAPAVHLFPLPGPTPGTAGLLLAQPSRTIIVAGDAVITRDHFEAGRIHDQVADADQAAASFAEVVEIADEIVPGHDNVFHVAGR